jgi:hypothetical protein
MDHIFDSINPVDMMTNTTGVIGSLAPLIELLIGILVAFLVLGIIINVLTGKKQSVVTSDEDDEDDDDFPY